MKIDIKKILDNDKLNCENWIEAALESEPGPNPNANPEPDPNLNANPEPESEPEESTDVDLDDETEVKAAKELELTLETNPESNPEPDPNLNANPEPDPNADLDPDPEPDPNANPEPDPNLNANPEPDPNPNANPEPDPNANPEPDPNLNANPEPDPNPNANPEPDPNANPEPDPNPESEPEESTDADLDDETEVKAAKELELALESNPESNPEPGPNPNANPDHTAKTNADSKSEITPDPEPESSLKKYSWIGALIAAFAILLTATFAYTNLVPREVNAIINGKEYNVTTKAYTIEKFLKDEGIKYCDADYISKPTSTYIYNGISFKMKHATDFEVTADGKTKKYKTLKRTVGEALEDCNVKVGAADIVEPSLDAEIGDNMTVIVQRVTTEQISVEENVPFKTVEKDDNSLNEGKTKVVTEGVDGKDEVVYEITYIDGIESSRREVSRTSITAAVDKIVAKGTKINFNGKSYSRKLVVKAYSYTGGGRTAMGTKARVGEIAVDPKVIPLGSNVYIEGVGARRAEDTGGNIKGNTIDIYMNTVSQCRKWGMRYVTIYIE